MKTFRSDKFLFFLFSVFFVTTIGCQENDCQNSTAELVDKKIIYAQNENIIFHGRVDFSNLQAPKIFWPGSGILRFYLQEKFWYAQIHWLRPFYKTNCFHDNFL